MKINEKFKRGDTVIFSKKVMDEVRAYESGEEYTYSPDFLRNVLEYGIVRRVMGSFLMGGRVLYSISDCEFYIHEDSLRRFGVDMK